MRNTPKNFEQYMLRSRFTKILADAKSAATQDISNVHLVNYGDLLVCLAEKMQPVTLDSQHYMGVAREFCRQVA